MDFTVNLDLLILRRNLAVDYLFQVVSPFLHILLWILIMDNEHFVSDAHSSKGDKAYFSGGNDLRNASVGTAECL